MNVQDSVFYKAFAWVFGALIFFTVSIVFLANAISTPDQTHKDPLVQAQLQDRLRPVGLSRIAE